MSEPGVYYTRSGRAVKPPERYGFENLRTRHFECRERNKNFSDIL